MVGKALETRDGGGCRAVSAFRNMILKTHKANPIKDANITETLCGRHYTIVVDRWREVTCHQCLRCGEAMDYREGIEDE